MIRLIFGFVGILVCSHVDAQINVFAGDDTSICPGGILELSELNAQITGEVDDGTWFSLGDGHFTPGNMNNIPFEDAETYVPGPGDINNGWFTLLLASNYGQEGQETDMVNISFQTAPPLVCNSSLNVSLSDLCEQEITPELILSNPSKPYHRYIITMYDEYNQLIENNILKKEHIGQVIGVGVSHSCDPVNSCWSEIRVEDKNPPDLICSNDTIKCTSNISPEVLGFPVSEGVQLEQLEDNRWKAIGLDECTDTELWYEDDEMKYTCSSLYEKVIFRKWIARDEYDNKISCIEEIYIRKDSLVDVTMPPNYDNIEKDALECGDDFKKLPNGYPHPDHTGYPDIINCTNLESTYSDVEFEVCGSGVKVLRAWLLIDWCTSESRDHNQIIKIHDTNPPQYKCPPDITVETTDYACESRSFLLEEDFNISDCSETTLSWSIFDSLDQLLADGGSNYIAELPLGIHNIEYTVTDVCGNSKPCTSKIYVKDRTAPTAVCDQYTSIALGADGIARLFAESLDDGSHDNCEILSMEVAKMTDKCDFGLERGPYVEFCCAEAGDTIMVSFTVTDIHGNENTCMVIVEVEEKLPPVLICPSDLTISCRYEIDFNDLSDLGKVVINEDLREDIIIIDGLNDGVVGIDGYTFDNCNVVIADEYSAPLECRQGIISRTFTATDDGGIKSSCTQHIEVVDEHPFDFNDIKWPVDYHDETCVDTSISPDISLRPEYLNDHCASLASTYKDKVFPFAEGSCMKIIREWTVIDWCQFDEKSLEGLWTWNQILKFDNIVAPTISNLCSDTIVCLYDEECLSTRYSTTIEAVDDCTLTNELSYIWTYDQNNDGDIDTSGTSHIIDIETIIGIHTIHVKVEDRCGNITNCTYILEVRDCKAPSPYCISEITTVLMDNNNEIEIWANDFNFNSSDNCTPMEELIFSFESDTSIRSRTLTCDDISNGISANVDLSMWVTDNSGNQEYCQVTVHVQDNNNNCEDQEFEVMVTGTVRTIPGVAVPNVSVELQASSPEYSSSYLTNDLGNYAFDNIPNYLEVGIKPSKVDEVDYGVSTLDIVLIQRHILGFRDLGSIDKLIAADVNGSGSITGADLVVIRKLILGVYDHFPNDVPSWKFTDKMIQITEENMHDLPSGISFDALSDDLFDVDFIGIKIGDVDDSVSKLRGNVNTRTDEELTLKGEFNIVDNPRIIKFLAERDVDIQGFQLTLEIPEGIEIERVESEFLNDFSPSNFHLVDGLLQISWSSDVDVALDEGDVLFTVIGNLGSGKELSSISINNERFNAEYYSDFTGFPVELTRIGFEREGVNHPDWKTIVHSNPFKNNVEITIFSPEERALNYIVYGTAGQVIAKGIYNTVKGENSFNIDEKVFPLEGLYFVSFHSQNWNRTIKLIKSH